MEYTGSNVQLDIEQTWKAGQVYLPNMATSYAEANLALSDISVTGHGDTEFLAEWLDMRDLLQTVFKNSSENLEACGTALRTALTDHVEQDGDNAMSLALADAREEVGDEAPEIPDPVEPE